METLKEILNKIKNIANIFIYVAVLVLLVIIYFKNNKIDNLEAKLLEKPKIEKIYLPPVTDTIVQNKLVPVEVIKWKTDTIVETEYEPIDLTLADSAQIAEAYIDLYSDYSETKLYDDVLKDDTTAFIRLKEEVQYNTIKNRELFFTDRTPIIKETIPKQDKTFSIIGGVDGNFQELNFGMGAVTNKNVVYVVKYDPFNKTFGGALYFPLFNF